MFMFYKMHNGLVTIHPTLYLTPRQYHTSHKYYIPHSRIDQHAFSFCPSRPLLLDCGTNYQPVQQRHHHSTSLRPGWRYCKAFVIANQITFNTYGVSRRYDGSRPQSVFVLTCVRLWPCRPIREAQSRWQT